jgi:NMT1/THI5 like
MVKPQVRMLCSHISHMALHSVWRDSGVTQKHGFELIVDSANVPLADGTVITMPQRAPLLLDGKYDFLSGLHHETYIYRARGDRRFAYLAQAQNDWDDRVVARADIRSPKELEGQKVIVADRAPCVFGNLKHSLQIAGANLDAIEFVSLDSLAPDVCHRAVEAVARGEAVAASVDIPFDRQGEKRGLRQLPIPSVPVIHNATICANRDWVVANEDTTTAFLESMIDAIHFFKRQKSRVCEILERSLAPIIGIESADEIEHLHTVWAALLSPKPYPHPLAVWNVYNLDVAHDPNVNFIGPFEIWDTSYLRAIDDRGYIDELYDGAHMTRNPAVNPVI